MCIGADGCTAGESPILTLSDSQFFPCHTHTHTHDHMYMDTSTCICVPPPESLQRSVLLLHSRRSGPAGLWAQMFLWFDLCGYLNCTFSFEMWSLFRLLFSVFTLDEMMRSSLFPILAFNYMSGRYFFFEGLFFQSDSRHLVFCFLLSLNATQ